MRNTILLLLMIYVASKPIFAQEGLGQDILCTNIRYHYGEVLAHHKSIRELIVDGVSAIELNVGFVPSPKRSWAKTYKLPEIGIGIYRGSLGNDDVYGNITAVYPYANFPIRRWNKWDFNIHLGFGMGHVKKHFDPVDNIPNTAIGSGFNAFFKLMANSSFELAPNWTANGGIGFNHASNGSIKAPNKGLNVLTGSLGISHYWNGKRPKTNVVHKNPGEPENELLFVWSQGIKQISNSDSKEYYATSLSASYALGINARQKLGIGVDLFYDESATRENAKPMQKTSFGDRMSQAIIFLHDLDVYRVSILTQIGVYTLYKTEPTKPFYFRVGLRYKLTQRFLANLSLKAHMGMADFIEWGGGYRIAKDKKPKLSSRRTY